MPWENANSLHARLAAALPQVPSVCPDPQCDDSTWDHKCQLGGSTPNVELVNRIAAEVREWLRFEAGTWRQQSKVLEKMEPSSAGAFSLRMGADALATLAGTINLGSVT